MKWKSIEILRQYKSVTIFITDILFSPITLIELNMWFVFLKDFETEMKDYSKVCGYEIIIHKGLISSVVLYCIRVKCHL